ncbi:hypothetical protein [uncultured Cocleimonas sp.]|uniref:hypothetical protein n=1 Tax=uncultured Cocleimonas sp. TaxID=1051587 RepID=UPI00261AC2AC|nr:hypothetical protein [uncultured Cocleimonas sp.]
MAQKPKIFESVLKEDIEKKLPREFKKLINFTLLKNSKYSIICYPAMQNNSTTIVNSRSLTKALQKVKSKSILIIAHNFTEEAVVLSKEGDITLFSQSDFFWTDESIGNIRNK